MQLATEQNASIKVDRSGGPNESAAMLRVLAYGFCAAFWVYIINILL